MTECLTHECCVLLPQGAYLASVADATCKVRTLTTGISRDIHGKVMCPLPPSHLLELAQARGGL